MKRGVIFRAEGSYDWVCETHCADCGMTHKFWMTGKYKPFTKTHVLAEFKSKICGKHINIELSYEDFAEMTQPD